MNRSSFAFSAALVFSLVASPGFAPAAEVEGLPQPGEPQRMKFAEPVERTLGNGLRVIVVDRPAQPLASLALVFRSGAESDPGKLPGLANFTAGLLVRGTEKRSATQLAEDLEELGASIKTEATWDATSAYVTTLAKNAQPALAILADAVAHAKFIPAEIERLRKERIDEVEIEMERPGKIARAAVARLTLAGSAYGHTVNGLPASLKRITRADVLTHYQRTCRPELATLIIVGDLRSDDAFRLAEELFGSWAPPKAKTSAGEKSASTAKPTGPAAILIDLPEAGQAAVLLARRTPKRSEAGYYSSEVANTVLGGGYSARLNREVRIRRGLSYGCRSDLSAWRADGLFTAGCQTKNQSVPEVVSVILGEIKKLSQEAVEPEELTARRSVLTGDFQRQLETNDGYVQRIADFILHDQPANSFEPTLAAYEKITATEIQTIAQQQFPAEEMTIIVAGQAKVCAEPLRKIVPNLRVIAQDDLDLEAATLVRAKKKQK